jgi:hypothetical protein
MYADVDRVRFDATQHFLRVVQQQGRVLLASEANEQVAVLLHHLQTLARDLIGPRGGTSAVPDGTGFKIGPGFRVALSDDAKDLTLAAGHYWVGGMLCELEADTTFLTQPDHRPAEPFPTTGTHLVYLDAWERHVGAAEDPGLVEVALGGPDSCSRTRVVWQLKLLSETPSATPNSIRGRWAEVEANLGRLADGGRLSAGVDRAPRETDPCLAAPGSGYTGEDNQLIRVEIHTGGQLTGTPKPTFKWAYDNASVEHRLHRVNGTSVLLSQPPRDVRKSFPPGTRVELLADHEVRAGLPGLLTTVERVDEGDSYELILDHPAGFAVEEGETDEQGRPRWALLRRWDHTAESLAADGARTLTEGPALTLADGVQVTFAPPPAGSPPWTYRSGDHWTVPVRVATGDVVWPQRGRDPVALPPQGVEHRFAPLALFRPGTGVVDDAREFVKPAIG